MHNETHSFAFSKLRTALQSVGNVECSQSESRKVGLGSTVEERTMQRRIQIRTWDRDEVRRHLLHESTLVRSFVLIPNSDGTRLVKMSVVDSLHHHNVDGNALLDLSEEEVMQFIGIRELGVAKTLMRVIANLSLPQHINRPSSAPLSRGVEASKQIKYSSLDPFNAWEDPFSEDFAVGRLHPKRHSDFRVQHASLRVRGPLSSTEKKGIDTTQQGTADTLSFPIHTKDNAAQCQLTDEQEQVVKNPPFSVGPLERERRATEALSTFATLVDAQCEITLHWFTKSLSEFLGTEQACEELEEALFRLLVASLNVTSKSVKLKKSEFLFLVRHTFDNRDSSEFDAFFKHVSQQFGKIRLESLRRLRSLQTLFETMKGDDKLEKVCKAVKTERRVKSLDELVEAFEGLKPQEFDKLVMETQGFLEKTPEICEKRIIPDYILESNITAQPHRFLFLLICPSINPTSLLERVFLLRRQGRSIRQKNLTVIAVSSEESITSCIECVATLGIEKGFWVLIDCSKSAGTQTLNRLLRKVSCLIATRSESSINNTFRVFVRCVVDAVDITCVPQIVYTVGRVVHLEQ